MKCKLCGAVFEDDALFFCTGCGAMLRNPATGEVVSENREEYTPDTAENQQNGASAEENADVQAAVNKTVGKSFDDSEAELKAESTDEISDASANSDERQELKPQEELCIAKEREKESKPEIQPVFDDIPPEPVKVGVGRLIGASAIALFSGIVLVLVSVLFSLKLGLSGDGLHDRIENMEKWSVINAEIDGLSVSDSLYYEVDFDKATHNFADKTEFAVFLAKTDFLGFTADKAKAYADYILDGIGNEPTLEENELVEFFRSNGNTAKEIFGYEMQTADYNSIRSSLAKHETADKFSVSKIGWEINFHLESVKYIFSYVTLGIFTALFIVLLIWIAIIVNRKGKHLLGFYGNIFLWGGLITVLSGIAVSAGMAMAYVLTGEFACYLCSSLLLPSAVYTVCFGVISFIAGVILKKIKRSLKLRKAQD